MKPSLFTGWIAKSGWLLLLLPVALLIPGASGFPYPALPGAYSDIAISHYPNAIFLLDSLKTWHEIPLWSPLILSGYPFAANPLAGLWYPAGWLALVFPLPLGFNITSGLHLLWGGLGMFLLLRQMELRAVPAFLGALAFECMPKMFAHFGAGHLTLIYAITWTPWLILAHKKTRVGMHVAPGIVFGMILLADVRWSIPALGLWGLVVLDDLLKHRKPGAASGLFIKSGWRFANQVGLGLLLASALVVPLLEYTRLSTRASMSGGDFLSYSLPVSQLLNLLLPLSRSHEWVVYPGAGIFLLFVAGITMPEVRRRAGIWMVTAGLCVLLSISASLPLMGSLVGWLGLGLLRAPSRWMFLFCMAAAVIAAHTLDTLLEKNVVGDLRFAKLTVIGCTGFVWMLSTGIMFANGKLSLSLIWGCILLALASFLIFTSSRQPSAGWKFGVALICLIGLDLFSYDRQLFIYRSAGDVLAENHNLAAYFEKVDGQFRIYSPSYSLPQQTAARAGLELVNGIDPLQLDAYVSFFTRASGVPLLGYSVTLPPFANGDPATANAGYLPDPALLGLLNVRFITSSFDLDHSELKWVDQIGGNRIYENMRFRPRAWLQQGMEATSANIHPIEISSWSPGRIALDTEGPGVLVLSEVDYPGWEVQVDGIRHSVLQVAGILRGVELEAGDHSVVFQYRPIPVYAGLGLSGLGILVLLIIFMRGSRRSLK